MSKLDEQADELESRLQEIADDWRERLADPATARLVKDGQLKVSPLVTELLAAFPGHPVQNAVMPSAWTSRGYGPTEAPGSEGEEVPRQTGSVEDADEPVDRPGFPQQGDERPGDEPSQRMSGVPSTDLPYRPIQNSNPEGINQYTGKHGPINISKKIGDVKPSPAGYKKSPGDFTLAASAAAHYAKKNGEDAMLVVPGNSYGHKVFHIARVGDDISRMGNSFVSGSHEQSVAVVTKDGAVHQAVAVHEKRAADRSTQNSDNRRPDNPSRFPQGQVPGDGVPANEPERDATKKGSWLEGDDKPSEDDRLQHPDQPLSSETAPYHSEPTPEPSDAQKQHTPGDDAHKRPAGGLGSGMGGGTA